MQNHVVRAQVGTYNGASGYIPADITAGEEYTGTITFNVPTVNDINNCNVVCMMIDINTGRVINVAEAKITDPTGIGGINADGEGAEEVARYNAAGQMIAGPQKGLNIIKYADGTTRKVVVNYQLFYNQTSSPAGVSLPGIFFGHGSTAAQYGSNLAVVLE